MMRKVFLGLFVLATIVFFLPSLVSKVWGKSQLQSHLQTQLGGEIAIEKLSLHWWGKQHCQNVTWQDKLHGISITADRIEILANLVDCLRYKNKPLVVFVEGAKMQSNTNLRFIKKKKAKHLEMIFSPIKAKLMHRVVSFEKTEIQINDSLKVLSLGEINLQKDRMDITLGLPQKALSKMFKEAKKFPDDFVLEIPISTKLSGKALEKALLAFFLKNYGSIGK